MSGCGLLFLVSLGLACLGESTGLGAPATVQDLVNQFSATNYFDLMTNRLYTRNGMARDSGYGAQHNACRDSIATQFVNFGLSPYLDYCPYVFRGGYPVDAWNVVALKPGVQNPSNEVFVVGSHYDSHTSAGANDGATGIAGMLEMARIFSHYQFAKTVVFCAFDAEEVCDINNVCEVGSTHYVSQHLHDNIKAMVSVDMIGWQTSGTLHNTAEIDGRTATAATRTALALAVQAYGGGLATNIVNAEASDHRAFAEAGFQAVCLVEANWPNDPYYDRSPDYIEQPGYIDWTYAGKMCRSAIGYFATQLQIVDVTPRVVSIGPGTNSMIISFTGTPGCKYATDLRTNLDLSGWGAFQTNTASPVDGSFTTVDTQAATRGSAFYRARFVPN